MAAEAGLTCRAPAKVNLTLKVLGRRPDGHHDLESLVAFAGVHDTLSLEPSDGLSLTIAGPRAADAGGTSDNLVLNAALNLQARVPGLRAGAFHLIKRIPAGAGLGGGSSDAAAALRLLARLNHLAPDDPALAGAALATGADVPVCLTRRTVIMRGIGEKLEPVADFSRRFAVLVFPNAHASTGAVFQELGLKPGERADGAERDPLDVEDTGNDLTEAAIRVSPSISAALEVLRATRPLVARMSGSGSCCFGLYSDCRASAAAAGSIARLRPDWWVRTTTLG